MGHGGRRSDPNATVPAKVLNDPATRDNYTKRGERKVVITDQFENIVIIMNENRPELSTAFPSEDAWAAKEKVLDEAKNDP